MTKIFLVAMFLGCSCLMEAFVSARGRRNDEPAAFLYYKRHPNTMVRLSMSAGLMLGSWHLFALPWMGYG